MYGRNLSRLAPALLAAAILSTVPARGQTWNLAGSGDWNTPINWIGGVPNNSSAVVNFMNNENATVNISSSVAAQILNFNSGNYTITSSANQTLSSVQSINVGSAVTGVETINLASIAGGSLLFPSLSTLVITNSSTAAGTSLVIGPNTVIGTPGSGSVVVTGPGGTTISGSFAASPNNVVGGLFKDGPGALVFSGSGANLAGGLTLNGGTLALNYSTNTASKLAGGMLNLEGGVLSLVANPARPKLPRQTRCKTARAIASKAVA